MRKKFTAFLILTFVLGLSPINFVDAITQNQIDAEVQIVCPDNYGNWYSGSGTIIDSKGIILTNKHVVSDKFGGIIKTCAVGFVESINKEPNFGTSDNINLAEVKYYTTSNDMDAAILYLENPTNKTYPYINIWNSNSSSLQLGDKIEVIGFPSIGGSTITYTSGDFSGFGSSSSNTQNYIKTTAPLEHGNSGGATYNLVGQFIGIPTMVVAGTLNSLSYILSINSITSWLSGVLGNNYQQEIIYQTPSIESKIITIQEDNTPPNLNDLDVFYNIYNDNNEELGARGFPKNLGKIEEFNNIQFVLYQSQLSDIDENGLNKIYYYFDNKPHSLIGDSVKSHPVQNYKSDRVTISDRIVIQDPGTYYFTFFAEDNKGNISNPYVYEYKYEPDIFKEIKSIAFYKDSGLNNSLGSYEFKYNEGIDDILECKTRLSNIYFEWSYPENLEIDKYSVIIDNEGFGALIKPKSGTIINKSISSIIGLNEGKITEDYQYVYNYNGWSSAESIKGKYFRFIMKPFSNLNNQYLENKHKIFGMYYDPNLSKDLVCISSYDIKNKTPLSLNFSPELDYFNTQNTYNSLSFIDKNLSNQLKGKILLQVEAQGEAYYVYPNDSKRYYLGRPDDAFEIMRKLGLGATHSFITSYTTYPTHVSGKILLDVEQNGEAYYIYPKDRKAYYLGRPADAFRIMRDLGLGITNSDLNKIPPGSL